MKKAKGVITVRCKEGEKQNVAEKNCTEKHVAEKHVVEKHVEQNAALKNTEKEKLAKEKNNIIYYKMPCTACGKNGLNVESKKPSTMILGQQRQQTVRRTVQKPRGLILNVASKRRFILGRR